MASVEARDSPSAAAIAIGTAILSGVTGYFLGQASSIGLFGQSGTRGRGPRMTSGGAVAGDDQDDEDETDDEDEEDDDLQDLGELKAFADADGECKLVLVVRADLGMGKGKIAAQCSHATLACYKSLVAADSAHALLRRWERHGQAKVALKVDGEDDLLTLQAQALSLGLCARIIHDAGRTQIAAGSATVLGVGPAPKSVVDRVTGHLKLL